MSLDCYPFGEPQTIGLAEQPMGVDVAYDDNLFICITNNCHSIAIFDLKATQTSNSLTESNQDSLVKEFIIDENIVIDQVVYCKTGDYIACVGHNNDGRLAVYTIFGWRNVGVEPSIRELDISIDADRQSDRQSKLNCIHSCQRTGNLAVSFGDLIHIHKFIGNNEAANGDTSVLSQDANSTKRNLHDDLDDYQHDSDDQDSQASQADTVKELDHPVDLTRDADQLLRQQKFKHIISIKLSLWANKVCLVENYLSIITIDHIQVLKLELLTLQIQPDSSLDADQSQQQQQQSTDTGVGGLGGANKRAQGVDGAAVGLSNLNNNDNGCSRASNRAGGNADGGQSETTTSTSGLTTIESSSMISNSNSTSATNFSSVFNNTPSTSQCEGSSSNRDANNSLSIMTMSQQQADLDPDSPNGGGAADDSNQSGDVCVTWNLNTRKLVKLPTLMHNTSTELSSYHICHPLELLGPASESIACRVEAKLFSSEFCQNQLEPVVLLCKQFDFDKDPVKMAYLQPIYISNLDDQRRLASHSRAAGHHHHHHAKTTINQQENCDRISGAALANEAIRLDSRADTSAPNQSGRLLLKSADHELIASVTCFVATLTNCFVYSVHGKKVYRLQTITHPDLCLDFRPDLLNVHLLTPLGLQICSTGTCDSLFRYDWSSSADLNLSFVACNRMRVLTTRQFIVLISSYSGYNHHHLQQQQRPTTGATQADPQCLIEFIRKPTLGELANRIIHTVKRCQSISIRSNLLSYLHANAQLALSSCAGRQQFDDDESARSDAIELLRNATILLCKQLLQKKQTNAISNQKIDKTIKHLLDSSLCDLAQLMLLNDRPPSRLAEQSLTNESYDEAEELAVDCNHALIKIYLKHAKYSQALLDYLVGLQSAEQQSTRARIISYMYDYNPRLLIKFAQRFTSSQFFDDQGDSVIKPDAAGDSSSINRPFLLLLVDKLRQLAELDSTGINRATVLFTLAIQHNALGERQQCLTALTQIKPLNHLAITMCSNHEISHTIAGVVREHYPEVFKLFLKQLTKRDQEAAREFCRRAQRYIGDADDQQLLSECFVREATARKQRKSHQAAGRTEAGRRLGSAGHEHNNSDDDDDPDELEIFERRLEVLADLTPLEVADIIAEFRAQNDDEEEEGDAEATRAYLEACIRLEESRYILARLNENTQQ